jgi:hypothetical protein
VAPLQMLQLQCRRSCSGVMQVIVPSSRTCVFPYSCIVAHSSHHSSYLGNHETYTKRVFHCSADLLPGTFPASTIFSELLTSCARSNTRSLHVKCLALLSAFKGNRDLSTDLQFSSITLCENSFSDFQAAAYGQTGMK